MKKKKITLIIKLYEEIVRNCKKEEFVFCISGCSAVAG